MALFDRFAKWRGYVPAAELTAAVAQAQAKRAIDRRRKFEGARINRLSADAPTSPTDINADLRADGPTLIARARWMAQNDGYIRRGLRLVVNNVIGAGGIQLTPRIPSRANDSARYDQRSNDAIRAAWKAWGTRGVFESTGVFSARTFDRARVLGRVRDGESFVIKRFGKPTAANPFGFWLGLIDPLRVPHELNAPAPGTGNPIVMGVETDGDTGNRVAYWMRKNTRQSQSVTRVNTNYVRIPAENIIHDFDPEFAGQTRGFSGMVGAMRRAPMLDGYLEAALVAARNGASTMGWYVEEQDSNADYEGDEDDEADEDGDFIEELEPGLMRKMPRGWRPEMHNPAWPNTQHGEFVKSVVRYMAADLNVSYHAMAQDLENVNLSSIRHGSQEDREAYKQFQSDEIELFHRPVYLDWLFTALGAGQIKVGAVKELNDANIERYSGVTFTPRGWEFAEPLKDAQANVLNIQTGLDTPQRIVEARGWDWFEHLEQLAQNRQELDDRGLTVPLENISINAGAAPSEDNDE